MPIPPAWTHLEPVSLKALLEPPGRIPKALRLRPGSVPLEAALQVPMVHAARLLLELAVEKGGLVLTPGGALKRVDVWHVFDQTQWPGDDKARILAAHKVINEDDAHGVLFTRIALQAAGLLRKRLGVLKATKAAKALLAAQTAPALLEKLFEAVFWKMNLQDFDWNPIDFWPQHHMGVVLWSLSVAGHEWASASSLMQASTIIETLEGEPRPGFAEYAMVSRALRPLAWLGLLESRKQEIGADSAFDDAYRKAPLFDQFLQFSVRLMDEDEARH